MDDHHSWLMGEFNSRDDALAEIDRLASLAWDHPDNKCPCLSWETCSRLYAIRVPEDGTHHWSEPVVEVGSGGVRWLGNDHE